MYVCYSYIPESARAPTGTTDFQPRTTDTRTRVPHEIRSCLDQFATGDPVHRDALAAHGLGQTVRGECVKIDPKRSQSRTAHQKGGKAKQHVPHFLVLQAYNPESDANIPVKHR